MGCINEDYWMRNQLLEELARLYGIEVQHDSQGNGGLYYVDSNGIMKELNTIFDAFTNRERSFEDVMRFLSGKEGTDNE